MAASVKIMLSYNYCHFEVSKSTDENLSDSEINEMRKDVQRLADEAVRQYEKAKTIAAENSRKEENKMFFENRIKKYLEIPESERTEEQKAFIKQAEDEEYMKQYEFDEYDYEDDEETYEFENF